MPNPAIDRILSNLGQSDLLSKLEHVPSSDLNSLLMEVMRLRSTAITPQDLMKAYQTNRFVTPSSIDPLLFAKAEVELLEIAGPLGFTGLELSPLAPLANCSAIALADQNKIVSALRMTEVVADATNLMALESSLRRKSSAFDIKNISLCTIHRHVRAQAIDTGKGFTPHFKIFCALTAGKDVGNFEFEKQAMLSHLRLYKSYLVDTLKLSGISVVVKTLVKSGDSSRTASIFDHIAANLKGVDITHVEAPWAEHKYYQHTRFSLNIEHKGTQLNLGDGGFVDWGAKLTGNSTERMFTSGIGLELLIKLRQGLL